MRRAVNDSGSASAPRSVRLGMIALSAAPAAEEFLRDSSNGRPPSVSNFAAPTKLSTPPDSSATPGEAWVETGLVYANADGTPLNPDYVSRHFQTLCRQAGVPVIRFHDARHVSITLALLAGVLLKVVSARAGHSSTWFTQDRYVYHAVNRKAAE
jgi:integrase